MLKQPFTATVHFALVILMLIGFVLIGQQINMTLYKIGLIVLIFSTIIQIAFGNIPASLDFKRAMRLFCLFMSIILVVFAVGYVITPLLYALGR